MRAARTLALTLLATAALTGQARAAAVSLAQIGTFSAPVYVTAPPGDQRLFVVEQGGTVRVLRPGQPPRLFLDVTSRIAAGGERGLLSIAFAPDYATSGLFYTYFTTTTGDVEVDEFARSAGDPDAAEPSPRRTLFTITHREFANHNGGNLQFGPDGLLYAGTGDGGSGGDPHGNAQNDASLLGKLLRIDVRTPGARPEIFAKGLRNPWRFSFDRQTGDLVIGDVGQGTWEEVDFAAAPGRGQGANYGWDQFEGNMRFEGTAGPAGMTFPVITHSHDSGWCSITGGYVVRDPNLPELAGRYVYGDFCQGELRSATLPANRDNSLLNLHVANLSSFGEDSCGEVYVTSLDGPVYRLTSGASSGCAAGGGPPPATPAAADRTAPVVRLTAPRRQRRGRSVRFTLSCSEQCSATVTARALDRRAGQLRNRTLAAGARVPLRLTLTRAARRSLARALRRHRSVRLLLGVRASDAAANRAAQRVRIRLTR